MNSKITAPVITIDGSSGVGKGTISQLLAEHLKWHYLDSGALYRILAHACVKEHIEISQANERAILALCEHLDIRFGKGEIWLDGEQVEHLIRNETCGKNASKVAAMASVRSALLDRQRQFRAPPGLVADGRDMGTTVFPDARHKFFLTASARERGKRRFRQLNQMDNDVRIAGSPELEKIIRDIKERDERDRNRSVSPLRPADDAIIIDTDNKSIDSVFSEILAYCQF